MKILKKQKNKLEYGKERNSHLEMRVSKGFKEENMVREVFCIIVVLLSNIIPCNRLHILACNMVENTFTISESQYDNL